MIKSLPSVMANLINELTRFPGIGEKSALRMVLHIIDKDKDFLKNVGNAFLNLADKITFCKNCFNIADDELCEICKDEKRDQKTICVVEDAGDVISIEKSGQYKGKYHILKGLISPINNKKIEDLTINQLKNTVLNSSISEIILALNPTVEGEATSLYIKDYLKDTGVRITRLAYGIPMGGDIEYLDEFTMAVALQGRKDVD